MEKHEAKESVYDKERKYNNKHAPIDERKTKSNIDNSDVWQTAFNLWRNKIKDD